jgi:hypothetical protein
MILYRHVQYPCGMPSARTSGVRMCPDAPQKTALAYRNNASMRARPISSTPPSRHRTAISGALPLQAPRRAPSAGLAAPCSTTSVSRCMRGPCHSSDKRGRAHDASDLEGLGRGVVWMPYRL